MKLSITVITLNEASKIRECLESAAWADEIIVADSGSADGTTDIAREFTRNVFVEKNWMGYGKQKNRCAARAANDWILNIDADETVSAELRDEIQKLMSGSPSYPAYSVVRKNYIGNRWIRHGGWYPDRIIRLYNRKPAAFSETAVHEGIQTHGKTGALSGHLFHKTYDSLQDYFSRQDHYATLSARDMALAGRKARLTDLAFRPLFGFLKAYVLKRGFLEGYYGLALAYGLAVYSYKKYAKLLELNSQ